MKQLLKWATITYVAFAIFVAYMAPLKTPAICSGDSQTVMANAQHLVQDSSRLDGPNQNGLVARALDGFTIHYWGAEWCVPCKEFKAKEIPALRAKGAKVLIFDIDIDRQPKRVFFVPTLIIFKSGKVVSVIVGYKTCDEIVTLLTE